MILFNSNSLLVFFVVSSFLVHFSQSFPLSRRPRQASIGSTLETLITRFIRQIDWRNLLIRVIKATMDASIDGAANAFFPKKSRNRPDIQRAANQANSTECRGKTSQHSSQSSRVEELNEVTLNLSVITSSTSPPIGRAI